MWMETTECEVSAEVHFAQKLIFPLDFFRQFSWRSEKEILSILWYVLEEKLLR